MTLICFLCCSLTQAFNFIFVLLKQHCRDSQLIKLRQAHTLVVVHTLLLSMVSRFNIDQNNSLDFWWAASHTATVVQQQLNTKSRSDLTCALHSATSNSFFTFYGHHRVMPVQKTKEQHPTQENPHWFALTLWSFCLISLWNYHLIKEPILSTTGCKIL